MNRENIIRMAREAGFTEGDISLFPDLIAHFASLVAASERNKLAAWMIQFGFATGHGDTMEQLVDALGSEIVDRIECEIDTERSACAKVCDNRITNEAGMQREDYENRQCAAAIRARGNSETH